MLASNMDCPPESDGDGVPDADDNCPTVPNRDQLDRDEDGLGDACDLCPNTAATNPVDSNGCSDAQVDADADADGICDPGAPSYGPSACSGSDNCPHIPNPGQEDLDGDGLTDGVDPGCGA